MATDNVATVQYLLDTFDSLPPPERHEAAIAILRRVADLDYGPLDDESIDRIAEESFLEYDAREAADAEG